MIRHQRAFYVYYFYVLTIPHQLPTSPPSNSVSGFLPFPFTDGANALSRRLVLHQVEPRPGENKNFIYIMNVELEISSRFSILFEICIMD
jgi:hypothetical protein